MTNLSDDLKNAIDKNLPQMVGKELQDLLKQADWDRESLADLEDKYLTLKARNAQLEKLAHDEQDLRGRELKADTKERELATKEMMLTLREAHAAQRVEEIRELTQTVFQSNRLGYNINLQTPNPMAGQNIKDAYGTTIYQPCTLPTTGSVTKEE